MTRNFTFSAQPKTINPQIRYREEFEGEEISRHISVDPRLARGSVYAHHKPTQDSVQPIVYHPKPIKHRELFQHKTQNMEEEDNQEKIIQPDIVDIVDRPIEDDIATAAETYVERPPTPRLIAEEPGIDKEIQVCTNDLFNFDKEVRPMIKVIVQHILQRAQSEVHEEVELENIRKHRDLYEIERNTLLAELQRVELRSKRLQDEVKNRQTQQQKASEETQQLNSKVSTLGFAESFATDSIMNGMGILEERGDFIDEIEQSIEQTFLPWLSEEIAQSLKSKELDESIKKHTIQTLDSHLEISKSKLKQEYINHMESMRNDSMAALRVMLMEDVTGAKIQAALDKYEKSKATTIKNDDDPSSSNLDND